MLVTNSIDKKITTLLPSLSTSQKKAVLGVIKSYVEEDNPWKDELFVKEMDRRTEEFESGKVKTLTLDELELRARSNYKKK